MKRQDLAIVGIWYDGYYDIWEDFLELKEKFWKDCPYPMYIVNQTKELAYKKKYDVTVIHAGADAEYSRKIQTAIEQIDADYLLLVLEDFFFSRPVESKLLENVLNIVKENDLDYFSMPLSEFLPNKVGMPFKDYEGVYDFSPAFEYTLSAQPAIWNKKFLKRCVGSENYNAWVFEGVYIKSPKAHTEKFLSKCKVDKSNFLGFKHGALQGKMIPEIVRYYEGIGYKLKTKRPELPLSTVIKRKIRFSIPKSFITFLKKFIKNKSVASRYANEIDHQIQILNLD